jgi:hypothetical protein
VPLAGRFTSRSRSASTGAPVSWWRTFFLTLVVGAWLVAFGLLLYVNSQPDQVPSSEPVVRACEAAVPVNMGKPVTEFTHLFTERLIGAWQVRGLASWGQHRRTVWAAAVVVHGRRR